MWFLKILSAKWSRKQVVFFHFQTVKGQGRCPTSSRANCVRGSFLETLGIIRLGRILLLFQSFHLQTAWSYEPGWLALPRRFLSRYYMKRARPEPPFLYRDWKQCAWAVCYPLSLSLASFVGPPSRRDYLENFHPGSRLHNTGMPASRAGSVLLEGLSEGTS